jgi:uncharacterized protein (TIGR03437 family)
VGLKFIGLSLGVLILSFSELHAAPVLRLSSNTVGPLAIATAGATNTQTIEAFNAGDGSLALTFATSHPWISASLGAPRACRTLVTALGRNCSTIQLVVNTAGLPQGVSTAILTVNDPNAVDAPQTVTVTVRVGPVSVDVAPGGSRAVEFRTSSFVGASPTTQDGGKWLTVVTSAFGSFNFNYPYEIQFHPSSGMAPGSYSGSVVIGGGSNPADNQTLPVSMRVTTLPIAVPSTDRLTVRLAEGAPPLLYPFSPTVSVTNLGQGSLAVSSTAVSGGSWLKQDVIPPFFTIDPTGLPVGTSSGSITFTSNAVNGTLTVPVDLQIVPKGPPLIFFQGVLNNGTFEPGDAVSQGDIVIVKGEQLSFSPYTPGQAPPLVTKAGGTTVLVNGSAAPLFYTSYGQIAFQMPLDTPLGTAIVQVQRDDQAISNKAAVEVVARAPRLLVTVNQDGSINSAAAPAHAGDVLTIYAIGLGATSPSVGTGAPAPAVEPYARVTPTPRVAFGAALGKVFTTPQFAGLTPAFAGLYQVNVSVPAESPKGAVDLVVSVGDSASNTLTVYVQ